MKISNALNFDLILACDRDEYGITKFADFINFFNFELNSRPKIDKL